MMLFYIQNCLNFSEISRDFTWVLHSTTIRWTAAVRDLSLTTHFVIFLKLHRVYKQRGNVLNTTSTCFTIHMVLGSGTVPQWDTKSGKKFHTPERKKQWRKRLPKPVETVSGCCEEPAIFATFFHLRTPVERHHPEEALEKQHQKYCWHCRPGLCWSLIWRNK